MSLDSAVVGWSLEPVAVLTLLRLYGHVWKSSIYEYAARHRQLELMQWLYQVRCPMPELSTLAYLCISSASSNAVSMLQWVHSLQSEWFDKNDDDENVVNKTALLSSAASHCNLALIQWLRSELKAECNAATAANVNTDATAPSSNNAATASNNILHAATHQVDDAVAVAVEAAVAVAVVAAATRGNVDAAVAAAAAAAVATSCVAVAAVVVANGSVAAAADDADDATSCGADAFASLPTVAHIGVAVAGGTEELLVQQQCVLQLQLVDLSLLQTALLLQ
eukprot:2976-Heterococcus_DN1.PRE.1